MRNRRNNSCIVSIAIGAMFLLTMFFTFKFLLILAGVLLIIMGICNIC